jgi:hypothetical protein
LPDGLFLNQKSQFGEKNLGGLRLENVNIFYGHLVYFTDIWDFYVHLGHFVSIWYIISGFGIRYQEKSGIPEAVPSNAVVVDLMAFFP